MRKHLLHAALVVAYVLGARWVASTVYSRTHDRLEATFVGAFLPAWPVGVAMSALPPYEEACDAK